MLTSRILTPRLAVTALIWACALHAPASVAQISQNSADLKNRLASTGRATRESPSATASAAQPAGQTGNYIDAPDQGPPTPGPTDPNGPSS
jgi:hypothetical protein